jgi:metal-sulfur cluster biosynthetic enzyme
MTVIDGTTTVSAVDTALATVRDPELDEPITTLGFVASCTVSEEGQAQVRLRLPTYFCAPNFAFLMVADAYDAVTAVPGVVGAEVILDDHFASDAINAGVAARAGFVGSFEGEATDELDDLRATFLRKAVLAGTDQVCRPLVDAGLTPADLAALTLGATPVSPALDRLRHRRRDLGLPAEDSSLLLLDPATGDRIPESSVPLHLRRARLTRTGIDANTSICSGMLRARYSEAPHDREVP